MKKRPLRYQLRPYDEPPHQGRWVVWDTQEDKIGPTSWRFLHQGAAIEAVNRANNEAKKKKKKD